MIYFQTNLPVFRGKESSVRRRYSDFEWLRNELERDSKVRLYFKENIYERSGTVKGLLCIKISYILRNNKYIKNFVDRCPAATK